MKKVLCVLFSLAILITVMPLKGFAAEKSETVTIYGNKISADAKQLCFVAGDEDGYVFPELYDSSFKKYYYIGDNTFDCKLIAEKLPKLQNLVVIRSKVINKSALENLDDLVWLGFHQCDGTENLSFLKNLPQLKKFRYTNIYGDTQCESINPVSYLKNLTELSLDVKASAYKDLAALKNLTKLRTLELEVVSAKGAKVLGNLKNLRKLDIQVIDSEETVDLSFLSNLTKLEELDITERYSDTNSTGLSNVRSLKKLKTLGIHDFEYEDLSFVGEMKQLESLSVSYSNTSFTQSIENLTNLKELTLLDLTRRSADLSFISKLKNLETLHIMGQDFGSLKGISNLKNLKHFSIWLCEFDDLSELKKCSSLEDVVIYNNNSAFDAGWLAGLNIKDLRISAGSAPLENPEKLATLKKLEYLLLDFTGISEETAKKIKKAVPKCKIEVCELSYGDYNTVIY